MLQLSRSFQYYSNHHLSDPNSFHFLSHTVSVDLSTDSVLDIHFRNKPFLTMLHYLFVSSCVVLKTKSYFLLAHCLLYFLNSWRSFIPLLPTKVDFLNQTQHFFLLDSKGKRIALGFIIFTPSLSIFQSKLFS